MALDTKRLDQLHQYGFKFNGQEYYGVLNSVSFHFHHLDILTYTEDKWNNSISLLDRLYKEESLKWWKELSNEETDLIFREQCILDEEQRVTDDEIFQFYKIYKT